MTIDILLNTTLENPNETTNQTLLTVASNL